jgi:crotonobetainyl-CoA:carnitine CoA-transferase CaiB-like acyl-CoA transferase
MVGFMEITGDADGPPMLSGVPLVDLKAGDEVYANVLLALAELAETGRGREIHVSMLQAAASWLVTTLPLLDFDCDPSEVTRCGNEHRKFIPVNAYPTSDGFVFVAIGNDVQWERITEMDHFRQLRSESRKTNAGRITEQRAIHDEMAVATRQYTSAALMEELAKRKIPHAPINTIRQVRDTDAIASRVTTTITPDGRIINLPPMAVDLEQGVRELSFAPSYSEHTRAILEESGISEDEIDAFKLGGFIP